MVFVRKRPKRCLNDRCPEYNGGNTFISIAWDNEFIYKKGVTGK